MRTTDQLYQRIVRDIGEGLRERIADIGYPVGCGISPHPETIREMALYAAETVLNKLAE